MRVAHQVLTLLAVVSLGGATLALAQQPGPPCSLDRQAGDWGFVSTGKSGGNDLIATGTYHLDRDGKSTSHLFINTGTNFLDIDQTGNATINGDCILTQTWDTGGPPAHCVIVDDGNEIWCMYEPPKFSQVTLKRIHTRN